MCFSKGNNLCCCIITILSALIAGAGIAAIFFTGLLTSIIALPIVTLIVGVIGLIVILFSGIFCRNNCSNVKKVCIIPALVGAIVTSAFALSATALTVGIVGTAILIGAVAFFLVLSLISLIELLLHAFCQDTAEA